MTLRHCSRKAAADIDEILRTPQHAGGSSADLNMCLTADRGELEHGVEGGDFIDTDEAHLEELCHIFDGGAGNPAAVLLLGAPKDGNDRRGLLARGVVLEEILGPREVIRREIETLGLDGMQAAHAHGCRSNPKFVTPTQVGVQLANREAGFRLSPE